MQSNNNKENLSPYTVAISGASGAIYGLRALQFLLAQGFCVDVILSLTAHTVIQLEHGMSLTCDSTRALRDALVENLELDLSTGGELRVWSPDNQAAAVASGSYRSAGMFVIPCSMGSAARIATGTSEDLIARCADVCLKERFKLVLVPRECPLSDLHLENLLKLSRMGAHIVPAMPAFYHKPQSVMELVDFVVGKAMDAMGINNDLFKRWARPSGKGFQ